MAREKKTFESIDDMTRGEWVRVPGPKRQMANQETGEIISRRQWLNRNRGESVESYQKTYRHYREEREQRLRDRGLTDREIKKSTKERVPRSGGGGGGGEQESEGWDQRGPRDRRMYEGWKDKYEERHPGAKDVPGPNSDEYNRTLTDLKDKASKDPGGRYNRALKDLGWKSEDDNSPPGETPLKKEVA